jgi:DNA-binding transcriptional LysR family regulator
VRIALVVEDKLPGGLKTHPLFHDRLHLIFSPLHPWAEKNGITEADLKKEPFLLSLSSQV